MTVRGERDRGDAASVDVAYTLGFDGEPQQVSATVALRRTDGTWKLDAVAVPTQLTVDRAAERATVLGGAVPAGTVLLFPGAAPIGFDTPNLRATPSSAVVSFDAPVTTVVRVQVSRAGRAAVTAALRTAVRACLAPDADPRCPQPSGRTVPGSVRGSVDPGFPQMLRTDVGTGPRGLIEIIAKVGVQGSYRRLTFANRPVSNSGRFLLPVRARSYAAEPIELVWIAPL